MRVLFKLTYARDTFLGEKERSGAPDHRMWQSSADCYRKHYLELGLMTVGPLSTKFDLHSILATKVLWHPSLIPKVDSSHVAATTGF